MAAPKLIGKFLVEGNYPGLLEPGNVNLTNRPDVANADGSHSSVRSMSFEENGREILVPTVSDDGRIMTDDEAVAQYHKTGRHLGKFKDPASATTYAQRLHEQQESNMKPQPAASVTSSDWQVAPDSEWAVEPEAPAKPPVSQFKSFSSGLGQGASLGFSDEIAGAIDSALSGTTLGKVVQKARNALGPLGGGAGNDLSKPQTYQQTRDAYRTSNRTAQNDNPGSYFGGQVAGSFATPLPIKGSGLGGAIARGTVGGAVSGAGYSEAPTLGGVLSDAGVGAGTGALTSGAMYGAGAGANKLLHTESPSASLARLVPPAVSHFVPPAASDLAASAVDKSADLIRKVVDSAKGGNTKAMFLLNALSKTPDGAARIAAATAVQPEGTPEVTP